VCVCVCVCVCHFVCVCVCVCMCVCVCVCVYVSCVTKQSVTVYMFLCVSLCVCVSLCEITVLTDTILCTTLQDLRLGLVSIFVFYTPAYVVFFFLFCVSLFAGSCRQPLSLPSVLGCDRLTAHALCRSSAHEHDRDRCPHLTVAVFCPATSAMRMCRTRGHFASTSTATDPLDPHTPTPLTRAPATLAPAHACPRPRLPRPRLAHACTAHACTAHACLRLCGRIH
jgi:hypothetical protein